MSSFAFLKNRHWHRKVLNDAFGRSFWGFFAAAVFFGALCLWAKGAEAVQEALVGDLDLMLQLLPRMFVAISIAALLWIMLPREKLSSLVGRESGLLGLVLATLGGAVTPGGPSSAYALLAVLGASGADRGALVAYITSWATLGLQRILVWDVAFLGPEFAILRFAVSLPLPIIAGLIARRLPLALSVKGAPAPPGQGSKP